MPGWLIAVFVSLLVLAVVLAMILLFLKEEPSRTVSREEQQTVYRPQEQQTVAPPPVFRRRPPATFRRKQIQGRNPAPLPKRKFTPGQPNTNGGKIETRKIKVNLDAICRVTGRAIRVCKCAKCQEERAKSEA